MVLLQQLKEADSSLCVQSAHRQADKFTTLCSLDHLCDGGIVFIKNGKYLDRMTNILKTGESIENIGVVFQDSFYKANGTANKLATLKQCSFYATVDSVDLALSRFSKVFYDDFKNEIDDLADGRMNGTARVHPSSNIADDVFLGQGVEVAEGVIIHSGCVILANSRIGANTLLYPKVVLYRNTIIGQNCIIHSNTTIGSDGFSYNMLNGMHLKVWHFGGVHIDDSVEVGSNVTIDQGTFSPTTIGQGTKLDNQVHIAHNCKLGKGVIVCGQTGIAGSVTIGDYVVIGGAANIVPDVKIGAYAQIGGMAGVTRSVPEKAVYGGHPARPLKEWLKATATLRRLSVK